ncbi:hypothetical protein QFC22_002633 [Naganishia vaughanmartiniae]|uniref:Uncharacterized protein n=1 Tax=Naganishia vaughanmartiniae TaxID=1424756 RepID=A0ACC2XBP3_9TREE|nr:hypothetical protein QFC22_002633 [Naganishia vaughanmartiniae]
MTSLLPHQHRSTSDRLLNNYLSSQKQLSTALLTLLSHSHSSSSSLLAYVTSSPGVLFPVRRAVQYAAFEGPGSANGGYPDTSSAGDGDSGKWNEYIQSLEQFRKDLKQVHSLEEELSQVKRDREILVSRLIKATRSKPSKKDILRGTTKSHSGAGSDNGMSNGSVLSFRSDESERTSGGTSKRQSKLADAQAEVLGCEEHLRSLEVRLEEERSRVMKHGLMDRFKAMEDVGRMWQRQARLGIAELQRADGPDGPLLHPNAYEVESNGSIAPSQSASQIGYGSDGEHERSVGRAGGNRSRQQRVPPITGSVTGSIAEEDENQTSGSEDEGNLVVHENTRGGTGRVPAPAQSTHTLGTANGGAGSKRFSAGTGAGVPSITDFRNVQRRNSAGSSDGSSAGGRGHAGGRATQSEVGLGYNPPRSRANRHSIRRTFSSGLAGAGGRRAASDDGSSIRSLRGNGKKKGGFFRSLAKLFKTKPAGGEVGSVRGSRRGGGDSPPLTTRSTSGWTTRTDTNLRGARSGGNTRDDSSDEEDTMGRGAMMSVTNNRNNTWSVDKVGVPSATVKPSASTAGKTIKKSRSDLGAGGKSRSNSQSTITPVSGTSKVVSKPPGVGASSGVVRSNTMTSVGTAATDKASKRLRQGSITRTRAGGSNVGAPSIASVLENKSSAVGTGPKLMEVPKAPKSQVTPQMYQATAPPPTSQSLLTSPPPLSTSASAPLGFGGDDKRLSTVSKSAKSTASSTATAIPRSATTNLDTLGLGAPVGTASGHHRETTESTLDSLPPRGQTPLPPSKTLSPPAKSAMRASSPVPSMQPLPPPAPPAFMVTAPGPVVLDRPVAVEKQPEPVVASRAVAENDVQPLVAKDNAVERPSTPTGMTTDGESVYESAVESEDDEDESGRAPTAPVTKPQAPFSDAGSDSDDTAIMSRYKVVENTEGLAAKHKGVSTLPIEHFHTEEEEARDVVKNDTLRVPGQTGASTGKDDDYVTPGPVSVTESTLERRKSVRMNVPDSPSSPDHPRRTAAATNGNGWSSSRVGRVADSSDEDESAAYVKAKKGLQKYANLSSSSPGKTPKKKKSTTKSSSKTKA